MNESNSFSRLELRHFVALQTVAEEGSFRSAADVLGYTQSAISQQIAYLERVIGERVFERSGGSRPILLTMAGEIVLRHARVIMAELAAAKAEVAAFATGSAGGIRVGTCQSVGSQVIPRLTLELASSLPDTQMSVTESNNDKELTDLLEQGEIDVALIDAAGVSGQFEMIELMDDPFVLVVRADSILGELEQPIALKCLEDIPIVALRDCASGDKVNELVAEHGFQINVVFRCTDNATVITLVESGLGSALIPRLVVPRDNPNILAIPIDPAPPPRTLAAVWRSKRYQSPVLRAFLSIACDVARQFQWNDDSLPYHASVEAGSPTTDPSARLGRGASVVRLHHS